MNPSIGDGGSFPRRGTRPAGPFGPAPVEAQSHIALTRVIRLSSVFSVFSVVVLSVAQDRRSGIARRGHGGSIRLSSSADASSRQSTGIAAGVADALEGAEAEQLDAAARGSPSLHRLVPQQVGAQVLLVVVGEDRDHDRVAAQLAPAPRARRGSWRRRRCRRPARAPRASFCAIRIASPSSTPTTWSRRVEVDDRRDELVGDALDAVLADLVAGARASGELAGSSGWTVTVGVLRSQEAADAHDRAAGADAGDEGVRASARGSAAATRSRARSSSACASTLSSLRELARQERPPAARASSSASADAAEEAALLARSRGGSRRRGCGSGRCARGSSSRA